MSPDSFNILAIGDVVSRGGRQALAKLLPGLIAEYSINFTVVNGENSAGGAGIDLKCAKEIYSAGANVITLGDHAWRRNEVKEVFRLHAGKIVRPANYPRVEGGDGWISIKVAERKIGVMNILGRVFMNASLDCPFTTAERILKSNYGSCDLKLCDLHAEASSEKIAFLRYFDGQINVIWGTHTHVASADDQVTESGTGFVSDLGMTGSQAGVIGMDTEKALERFLTGVPNAYKPATGKEQIQGVVFRLEGTRVVSTERVIRSL